MFGILMLITAMTLSLAFAQPFNRGGQGFGHPEKGLLGIPDLNADQMKKIQKLRLDFQKEMLPLKTKIKAAKLDLDGLIMETADQKEIDKKIEEIGKMKIELEKKRIAHWMTIRNLLTDEQKAMFDLHKFGHTDKNCAEPGPHFGEDGRRAPMHRQWE